MTSRVKANSLSRTQVNTAKKAAKYLEEHMNSEITVNDLAEQFHISQSHLQNAFKGVYGVTIFAYKRQLRMEAAAEMLVHSDMSVLEIANTFGYDNASKFAAAFRKVMGLTPVEYRKSNYKI